MKMNINTARIVFTLLMLAYHSLATWDLVHGNLSLSLWYVVSFITLVTFAIFCPKGE